MEWINIKDKLPQKGETTKWKANIWRYGKIHSVGEFESRYLGINNIVGDSEPMWERDSDEDYPEVTHWMPVL